MSFARELKDFSEGMGKGAEFVNKAADAKYRRALAEQARGPTLAEQDRPGGFPDGSGGVLPDGSAPATSSDTPKGGVAVDINGDPEAGKVLAFIRAHEGGTDNPYNRLVYGGPNKFANLTDMSIADVLKYQGGMTKAGHASSALGAYQFVNKTLTDAVQNLKLDPNQKFDQATQDRLGYYLLQKRGWGDYKEGRLGKDQLMDNLAHEWAALPLASGKSVYQGDKAGNKAGVGRDAFAAIVPDFGQGKGGTAAAPTAPTSASGPPETPSPAQGATTPGTVLPAPDEPADTVGPVAGAAGATQSSTPPAKTGNYFLDEATRTQLDPNLSRVVERAARDNPGLFALNPLTKTFRTEAEQKDMVDKGWSKTMKSKHRENKAIDLVPINPATGQADPNYTPGYSKIEQAMRKAQKDEGVQQLDWGGNWKRFKDQPHWQVAQLEQQEIDAGGQAPGNPNAQVQPVMWAERGGVIPTPAYADGGGVNPAGDPDKYNPNRAYTQAVPATTGTTTTPRRIKLSGDSTAGSASAEPPAWRSWGAGGSPTQQKVATARSDRAAAEAAAAAAAAQQQPQNTGYQQQLSDWEKKRNDWTGGQTHFSNMYAIPMMQAKAVEAAGAAPAPGEGASSGDQALYMAYQQKYAAPTNYQSYYGSGAGYGGSRHEAGGMVRLEEGGIIPEPGYARGGQVDDPNRARAAARGEVYSATRDDKYWRSRQPTVGKSGRRDESGIGYTSVAGERDRSPTRPARPSGGGRGAGSGRSVSAGASEKQHKFEDLPRTAPRPSPRSGTESAPPLARAAGTPTEGYEPKARAAGTPFPPQPSTFPARPEVHSDNTYPVRPQQGPPAPPRVVQPGSKGHSEPPPDSAIVDIDPRRFGRSGSGPPPAIDNGMSTIPGVRNAVPGYDVPRGGTWVDPNTGQPTAPPPAVIPPPEQGAWVNGQWVPIDTTAAAGQGFARGGKVSHKDTTSSARKGRSYSPTFQSSRAESAGYTTSSPGWRRDEDEPVLPTESSFPTAPKSSGGGSSSADPDTPTKPDIAILEDRASRWRGSDFPIIEDRASRWGPGDYPLVPPHGSQQATTRPDLIPPHGSQQPTTTPVIVVPETAPPPDQLDVTVAPMDPGATGVPRYADGGVIDDPDQMAASPRAESAGYATSAPAAPVVARPAPGATPARAAPAAAPPAAVPPAAQSAAPPEPETPKADVQPTPRLLEDVANGIKGGAQFLRRVFSLDGRGDGTLPTPESRQARSQGMRRFATGEGAATQEEINSIDDQVDPNRELDEGKRQLNRLANITQFYLERGQKDKAEAAAGSLLQYGANRFGRLGSLAAAAYKNGDINKTVQYLEQAYKMIPDGADISVSVDREKGVLLATHTDADGKETVHQVQAGELPGMLKQTMDKSAYWSGVFRMADPALARQREQQSFEVGKEREKRGYDAGIEAAKNARELQEEIDKERRGAGAEIEKEKRGTAAEIEKEQRAVTTETTKDVRELQQEKDKEVREKAKQIELKLIDAGIPAKPAAGDVNIEKLSPLFASATEAEEALKADKNNPDLQTARDQAVSRLFDEIKDPAKLEKLGWGTGQYKYVEKTAPAQIVDAQGKPMQTSGEPRKAPDGKWYVKGANGNYIEVAPQAAAPAPAT